MSDEKISVIEVSEILGVNKPGIFNVLKRLGIKTLKQRHPAHGNRPIALITHTEFERVKQDLKAKRNATGSTASRIQRKVPKGTVMDLKEFVAESLRQIMDGVAEAKKHGKSIGAQVNPCARLGRTARLPEGVLYRETEDGGQYAQNVSFDVAVTTIEASSSKGGARLAVAVFAAGRDKQSNRTNSSVSRVQFTVPVFLP